MLSIWPLSHTPKQGTISQNLVALAATMRHWWTIAICYLYGSPDTSQDCTETSLCSVRDVKQLNCYIPTVHLFRHVMHSMNITTLIVL